MWRGHLRKPRGNAWLLQNGIGARPKISLLKKEPLGSGSDLFACLLYASVLPCLHNNSSYFGIVPYGTIIEHRTAIVKGERLTFTHNSFGGPTARFEGKRNARTPRAPAEDFVPCTPEFSTS